MQGTSKNIAPSVDGVTVLRFEKVAHFGVLTAEALEFIAALHRQFGAKRIELLAKRVERQEALDRGEVPVFRPETEMIRRANWTVRPIPADLLHRPVEITGPTERKMVINALNSGASHFMADGEDSLCQTWENVVAGQVNLTDAIGGTISYVDPRTKKEYRLGPSPAVLMFRPRGLHLAEKHILVDGEEVSGILVDLGLYVLRNGALLVERGTAPYFYIPKLEGAEEAAFVREVFAFTESYAGLSHGTIRATVLIETILAAFEMDEILWELRDYIAGLNCGRWDYIFSMIKKFRRDPDWVMPDRSEVTMATHLMRSYSRLLIKTCHRRGALAMGGMAAQVPIKGDPVANDAAIAKVMADKEREVDDGHDGTWVAHPALAAPVRDLFAKKMRGPNQLGVKREDVTVSAADLLELPKGSRTEKGLRMNITVSILYLSAWLSGLGCVALFNLMEDAATAEISRGQVWEWLHKGVILDDGQAVDKILVASLITEEVEKIRVDFAKASWIGRLNDAVSLFEELVYGEEFVEFLTLPAYDRIVRYEEEEAITDAKAV